MQSGDLIDAAAQTKRAAIRRTVSFYSLPVNPILIDLRNDGELPKTGPRRYQSHFDMRSDRPRRENIHTRLSIALTKRSGRGLVSSQSLMGISRLIIDHASIDNDDMGNDRMGIKNFNGPNDFEKSGGLLRRIAKKFSEIDFSPFFKNNLKTTLTHSNDTIMNGASQDSGSSSVSDEFTVPKSMQFHIVGTIPSDSSHSILSTSKHSRMLTRFKSVLFGKKDLSPPIKADRSSNRSQQNTLDTLVASELLPISERILSNITKLKTPSSYEKIKLIGRGDVGKVFLVKDKENKKLYAMKGLYHFLL